MKLNYPYTLPAAGEWAVLGRERKNMKTTLSDLNNHLFEQLERLNDDDLDEDQLEKELKRAKGMTAIASQIIQNGQLAYKVMTHRDEYGNDHDVPHMLEAGDE